MKYKPRKTKKKPKPKIQKDLNQSFCTLAEAMAGTANSLEKFSIAHRKLDKYQKFQENKSVQATKD